LGTDRICFLFFTKHDVNNIFRTEKPYVISRKYMQTPKNADPLVSICIPVYNSDKTIRRTIESVIGQTYKNIEIIVIDNLSTDATLERVREYKDSRIRIVENPVHFSCAEDNWNTCFNHTHGEFIALFHADDVYSPYIVAKQVDTFRKFPTIGGVFTEGNIIDEHDRVIDAFRLPPKFKGDTPCTYQELLPVVLEHGDFLLCPSAMIRSDLYKKLAPFRYNQFGSASDLDMWLRVAGTCPVIIINEKLINYRLSKTQGTNILNRERTQEGDFFRVMDFHTAESRTHVDLSSDTLGRYELRRMEDQVFCALNYVKKHDFSGFRQHVKNMVWGKYIRIILVKPHISLPVLIRGFFKLLNNISQQNSL
jgi:glycosyltransferase involved in cell wall biosynthesis